MNTYKLGTMVRVDDKYLKTTYGRKYGVVKYVKFSDGMTIIGVILPVDNGMMLHADIQEDRLKPITERDWNL